MTAISAPAFDFRFWAGPVREIEVAGPSDVPKANPAGGANSAPSAAASSPLVFPTLGPDLIAALVKVQANSSSDGEGAAGDASTPSQFTRDLFQATTGDTLSTETERGITAFAIRDASGNLVSPMGSGGFSAPALLASDLTMAQAYAGNGPTFDPTTIAGLFTQMQSQGESLPSGWLANAHAWLQLHGAAASPPSGSRSSTV
jgi:hypothetical protein